jgi:hypothetical protein
MNPDIIRRAVDSRMVSVLPRGGDFGRADMLNAAGSKRPGPAAVIALLCAGLAGCAMHWPWRHRAPPAPQPVQEGTATLMPLAARGWPIRLEFRVQPGSIAHLEVQGRERIVFELPGQGAPVLFRLAPDAYLPDTPQISLRWSAAGD